MATRFIGDFPVPKPRYANLYENQLFFVYQGQKTSTLKSHAYSDRSFRGFWYRTRNHQSDLSCARLLDTTGDGTNAGGHGLIWKSRHSTKKEEGRRKGRSAGL